VWRRWEVESLERGLEWQGWEAALLELELALLGLELLSLGFELLEAAEPVAACVELVWKELVQWGLLVWLVVLWWMDWLTGALLVRLSWEL
jgi:hypothetical protein